MYKYLRFLVPVLALFSSGCSSVYMPNVPNTPMLSKQGEFSGGGHISLKGNASLNGAYAVSNHIGVLFSASLMDNERKTKDFNHKLVEIGGGYYDTFGPNNNRIIEIYGGFGKGWSNITYRDFNNDNVLTNTDIQKIDFRKTFIQVNYSSKKKHNFQLFGKNFPINYGTALRLSHVSMDRFLLNGIAQPKEDNIFFEPIFFTRMALSKTVQLQYTTSSNIGLKSKKYLSAGNSIFTLGLVINVGGK